MVVSKIKVVGGIGIGIAAFILCLNFPSTPKYISSLFFKIQADATEGENAAKSPSGMTSPLPNPPLFEYFDVVVYGDEVPGICAAIWAKKTLGAKSRVALIRANAANAPFGGLLTRGGLAYLDFDKTPGWYRQPYAQCFMEFLDKANIKEACVEPKSAAQALKKMLADAGVNVISNATLTPHIADKKIKYATVEGTSARIQANSYIDTTQDAELARKSGLSYYLGYESQNSKLKEETLAVSIVPIIKGLTIADLTRVEAKILNDDKLMNQIEKQVRDNQPPDSAAFWLQNFDLPIFQRYQDGYYLRSIALGAAYHLSHQQKFIPPGKFFFDKLNICAIHRDELSWNGLLFKYTTSQVRQLEDNGFKPNSEMIQEMKSVEAWLRKVSGKNNIQVIIPPEVYIRHSLSIRDVIDPLSSQEILKGGTFPEDSIGTFSYEFDFRGGVKGLNIKMPPLPMYNFGIESALAKPITNLAVVGRSSGYTGIAVSVGRILTVNIYQGQGIGVAAALANQLKKPLNQMTSQQVRDALENMTGRETRLQGIDATEGVDYSEIK